MRWNLFFALLFVICHLTFVICSFAEAKEYDGIWFLGFNLSKPPFYHLKARQAVSHSLNTSFIALTIMSEETVPAGLIPPAMSGSDPALKPYKFNLKFAKSLLKQAGYPPTDQRLKGLTLLHTDGIKTVEIARRIQADLKPLGMKIALIEVDYRDEEKWQRELASKKHSLFLMGYKAEIEQLFTDEAKAADPDSASLLEPLFKSSGKFNFTGYNNPKADSLFESSALDREAKLKAINRLLYQDLPALVLFYIEKL